MKLRSYHVALNLHYNSIKFINFKNITYIYIYINITLNVN